MSGAVTGALPEARAGPASHSAGAATSAAARSVRPRATPAPGVRGASPAAGAIHFAGRVPHGEVERYYSLCDVMAYPRKRSRLTDLVTPLKPLEAMAQGTLVAASDVGGHRELVADGRTGMLFAPDDPAACGAALARLLGAQGDWERLREAGRAHVRAHHDWARNVERYLDIYQNRLGVSPKGRIPAAA